MKMPLAYSNVPMAPSHNIAPFCNRERNPVDMVFSSVKTVSLVGTLSQIVGKCHQPDPRRPLPRSVIIQRLQLLMPNHKAFSSGRRMQVAAFVPTLVIVLVAVGCGGGGSPTTPTSNVKNRAFISNTYSGNLQIVNTQNDTTGFTAETTNSSGQVIPGSPVTVAVGTSVTFESITPDRSKTLCYDPNA